MTQEEIIHKFNFLTERYFDQEKRARIIEGLRNFENQRNIAEMADLLRQV